MIEPAWREIVTSFLKVGATAYGGPAIMGVMQAEFQERRQWVTKARFLEGLALVNVRPGATATRLGIFVVALYRLGRSAMRGWPHRCIAVAAAVAALVSPLGTVAILLLLWQIAPVKAILAGAVVGVVRSRICELAGVRAVLCAAGGR
jgi:chromate transport protein ChrA